jgi:hypothetical protein
MYSTWYSYHQRVDADTLLREMAAGRKLGFESISVDDGWQTLDSARGYAFTGDWRPERMPEMKGFVDATHALGAVLLWYAVPFVGQERPGGGALQDGPSTRRAAGRSCSTPLPRVRSLVDIQGIASGRRRFAGLHQRFVADSRLCWRPRRARLRLGQRAADRLMTEVRGVGR